MIILIIFLRLMQIILCIKVLFVLSIPYQMLIGNRRGKEDSIYFNTQDEIIILIIIFIINIILFFFFQDVNVYDKYSFLIALVVVIFSYLHAFIMVKVFEKLKFFKT